MQDVAIHGPRPRPDARAHIAAALAAHRAASRLSGAAVSFGDYELFGDAADIMATQRIRQRLVTAVRTGISCLAVALVSASVVLTAAIICAGAAGADPSQQDQFVALLGQEQIPPVDDDQVAGVVARAHQICGEANGGTPLDTLVNDEMNRGYDDNPRLHLYPDRVRRTAVRFVTASVDVYCPSHKGELPPYE